MEIHGPSDYICRPEKLTGRWVYEMTSTIQQVCPEMPSVSRSIANHNPNVAWNTYTTQLKLSPCFHNSIVKKLLSYEIDYNSIFKDQCLRETKT